MPCLAVGADHAFGTHSVEKTQPKEMTMKCDLTENNEKIGSCPPTAFLSERQAAAYLNMSVSWLRKCRDQGTGPVWMKFGNSIRYPESALEGYVRQSIRNFTGEYRILPNTLI